LPRGIPTFSGYSADTSADIDLVVVGNAISRGNPELESVLERKIRYCSLPEAIRDHFLWGARRSSLPEPRQDDDHVADRLAVDHAAPIRRARRRYCAQLW
jgi:hypothetical protein